MSSGAAGIWAMRTGDFIATEFPGDSAGLAASIAYIGSIGGLVQICSGTFTGLSTITGQSKLTIQGAGTGQTILKLANGVNSHLFNFVSKTDICIRDLQIDGNKANNSGSDNMNARAVLCSRVRFENVYSHDAVMDGFYVSGCTDVTFDSCISESNGRNGYSCGDANGATSRVNFYACTSSGHSGTDDIGFAIETANSATLHGCRSVGDYLAISALGTSGTPMDNVTIEACKLIDYVNVGITVGPGGNQVARNVKVINNELKPSTTAVNGITAHSMEDFEIIGNTIEPSDPAVAFTAISLQGTTSVALSTTANGTTLLTSAGLFITNGIRVGDYVTGGSPAPPAGCFVRSITDASNLILSAAITAGTEPQSRTFTRAVHRFVVANNRIDSPGDYGINGTFCKHGTVSGNVFRNCSKRSAGTRDAVRFDGAGQCADIAIVGNAFVDDQATPTTNFAINTIGGSATSTRFAVTGNTFRGMSNVNVIQLAGQNAVGPNAGLPRPSIAADAATKTLPEYGEVIEVTGSPGTTITSITASRAGRVVTLVFPGTAALTDGSNLKLNGNFTAAGTTNDNDTLTLCCDGTNWFEIARSAN